MEVEMPWHRVVYEYNQIWADGYKLAPTSKRYKNYRIAIKEVVPVDNTAGYIHVKNGEYLYYPDKEEKD